MGTGRNNKLVGQTGEYLVAAELSRRGYIATTFTGNVPDYDIIASNEKGKHVSVQVKASSGSSWQFGDVSRYFEISYKGRRQIVGRPKKCPVQRLVVVFVAIDPKGNDRFYILTWRALRDSLRKGHKAYLAAHGGKRPQKWDSLHAAIQEKHLTPHLNRWEVVTQCLN
jgi:Holliday junction resolvase-like predicted endonuclease